VRQKRSVHRKVSWLAALAGASALLAFASPASADLGISSFSVTPSSTQAAGHPDVTIDTVFSGVSDNLRSLALHLPAGLVGNPNAAAKCSQADFDADACPGNSVVGTVTNSVTATPLGLLPTTLTLTDSVFNVAPGPGEPARLGIWVHTPLIGGAVVDNVKLPVTVSVRPGDFGLDTAIVNIPNTLGSLLLGDIPIQINSISLTLNGTASGGNFVTLPSSCSPATTRVDVGSYGAHGAAAQSTFTPTGCGSPGVPFNPSMSVDLETTRTDTPSGYTVTLGVPSNNSTVRRAQVLLPQGTMLSPKSADGATACTDAQLGAGNAAPAACPAGSQIGTTSIVTPLLGTLAGKVFLGQPTPGHLLRLFVDIEQSGVKIKLPGDATPDPSTGQLTTVFDNLPQVPFTSFALSFRGGPAAILSNPADCGSHTAVAALTPWSGGAVKSPQDTFTTSFNGAGAACPPKPPFTPAVSDSAANTAAGGDPGSLAITVTRPDRDQRLRNVRFSLPPGLLGKVAGVSLCPEAAAASGDCPANTRAGTVTATVGTGPSPVTLSGPVYMGGPYKGGLLSLIAALPAKVGPLDLGTTVLRSAISLRSSDAGLDVVSDDLPRFVQGIPVDVRTLTVDLNKPGVLLNPTSCAPLAIGGTLTSVAGDLATASAPFQATACDRLPFAPKIIAVAGGKGNTRKGQRPLFRTIVEQPIEQARLASTTVTLPPALGVASGKQPCPVAQADAGSCPATSQVGTANATTPLLPGELSGPVYLIQQPGSPLPGVLVQLRGLVNLSLRGSVSIGTGGLATTFNGIPDVPISHFELVFTGGKDGTLITSRDLCRGSGLTLKTAFTGHNGANFSRTSPVGIQGCKPTITVSVRHANSAHPAALISFREPAVSSPLSKLTLSLPAALRGKRGARQGVTVIAGKRKLGRRSFHLTDRTLVLQNLPAGTHVLKVGLSKGAIKLRKTRLGPGGGKRPTLSFGLRAVDEAGTPTSYSVKTRAAA
jgi:hypothetical protein